MSSVGGIRAPFPSGLRGFSAIAAAILVGAALVILARAGAIGWPARWAGLLVPASWVIAAFLALNTLANLGLEEPRRTDRVRGDDRRRGSPQRLRRPVLTSSRSAVESRTAAGGTRMTSHGEWTPHGWFRLAFPVFIRGMRRPDRHVIAKARRALEEELDRQSRRSPTPIAEGSW
jgi:hypothetical protein